MHWIVGDIHGMIRPLDALLRAIPQRDPAAEFIFVGDYVNRGPASPAVIKRLLTLKNATFLRGNHDDILDFILNGQCYIVHQDVPDPVTAFSWFMQHGLDNTLTAYGADLAQLHHLLQHPDPRLLARIVQVVPEEHRRFIRALLPVAEFDDFFVAHAWWDPDVEDASPDIAFRAAQDELVRYKLLWGRYTDIDLIRKKRWKRRGYFGHTPVGNYRRGDPVPIGGEQIILLDTGAALGPTGRLTAVCAENDEVVQADRNGIIIQEKAT